MKEFVFLFRTAADARANMSESDMMALEKRWYDWMGGIAAQGKMVSNGMRLNTDGKVLKAGGIVTDGPFVEIRERLGGFIVIKADSYDDAVTMAHGCPALELGGSVEVRTEFVKP